MLKIKLLKPTPRGNKGDIVEIDNFMGNLLIRDKSAVFVKDLGHHNERVDYMKSQIISCKFKIKELNNKIEMYKEKIRIKQLEEYKEKRR